MISRGIQNPRRLGFCGGIFWGLVFAGVRNHLGLPCPYSPFKDGPQWRAVVAEYL